MPSSRAAELGAPLLRREDERLLRGEGRFVADVPCPGALHAAFVRSGYAHAVVNGLEGLAEARRGAGRRGGADGGGRGRARRAVPSSARSSA